MPLAFLQLHAPPPTAQEGHVSGVNPAAAGMSGDRSAGSMAAIAFGRRLAGSSCHGLDIPFTGEKIPRAGQ